ncbi:MAG: hypothetical protein IKV87_02890 [Methanobrevibacter sp.]|nr:hypothetical protein [Methanobrevibacter sp.]
MEPMQNISNIEGIVPSNETYSLVNLLFQNKLFKSKEINSNSLTISCLNLIDVERINLTFDDEIDSINLSKNPILKKGQMEKELEIMKNIQFKINSKEMKKLNQRDQTILKMFKDINKNHEFDLRSMYEKISKKEVSINFAKYFNDYAKSIERENKYSEDNYKDIIKDGEFTLKGNELNKEWKEFKNNLKSNKSFYKVDNEEEIFDKYLIYGRCFEMEKDVMKNIEKAKPQYDSSLYTFLKYDGPDLLKMIFDKGLSNSKIERKGDGSVPAGNSKYFVPGFG